MKQHAAQRVVGLGGLLLLAACAKPVAPVNLPGGVASPRGTLTVSWRAPTKNTNGTPLTDLAGYTIYYGTKPGVYTTSILLADPSATHLEVHGLEPGVRYYFAISADSTTGQHSALSSGAPPPADVR